MKGQRFSSRRKSIGQRTSPWVCAAAVAATLGMPNGGTVSALEADHSAATASRSDLGILTPFYRATQVQGHVPGQGLMTIPAFLTDGSTDVGYKRNAKLRKEIPFVDSFTINRFLGGYSPAMLRQGRKFWGGASADAGDFVVRDASGKLESRPEVIEKHLTPYLDAGYRLSDITINLENVPWAIAASGGDLGPYGQRNPPANSGDWKTTIDLLVRELKRDGGGGGSPSFKVGNEFDTKKSFNGDAAEYFDLFETSARAIRASFPAASIASGEFTGRGSCDARPTCVYSTGDLLAVTKRDDIAPTYVPRSLHALQDQPANAMPSRTVARAAASYRNLGGVRAEIHQFGLLGQPFGSFAEFGRDQGPRTAAWEFLVLAGLMKDLKPSRVFHWDAFYQAPNSDVAVLNGTGFLRLFLDRYLGAHVSRLALGASADRSVEMGALSFALPDRVAVILASFDPDARPGADTLATLDLERLGLGSPDTAAWRAITFDRSDDPFMAIRSDLVKAGNLRPEFLACDDCSAEPRRFAVDNAKAREMIVKHHAAYDEVTARALKWRPLSTLPGARSSTGGLTLAVPRNGLIILERPLGRE